jgi:hypothetical protein
MRDITLSITKAKDQLRQQLITNPPEATEKNIFSTVEQFVFDGDSLPNMASWDMSIPGRKPFSDEELARGSTKRAMQQGLE